MIFTSKFDDETIVRGKHPGQIKEKYQSMAEAEQDRVRKELLRNHEDHWFRREQKQ
jgi:hypothetical protein